MSNGRQDLENTNDPSSEGCLYSGRRSEGFLSLRWLEELPATVALMLLAGLAARGRDGSTRGRLSDCDFDCGNR